MLAKEKERTHVKYLSKHIGQLFFSRREVKVHVLVENEPSEVVLPSKEMSGTRLYSKFLRQVNGGGIVNQEAKLSRLEMEISQELLDKH